MVILESEPGQLANRTFYFAFFIANALHHGYRLYNPHFGEFQHWFPHLGDKTLTRGLIRLELPQGATFDYFYPRIKYHLQTRDTRNRIHLSLHIWQHDQQNREYDLNQKKFVRAAKWKICWISGWKFRDHKNLPKYHPVIKALFTPSDAVLGAVGKQLKAAREKADTVIGVHMRGKDYREFCQGKYFFSPETYLEKMLLLRDELAGQGKEVTFLVCSDEEVQFGDTRPQGLHLIQPRGDAITDLYTLAHCDYLLGPPSTFSMWASYWGKVPLCMLQEESQNIRLQDFKRIVSMDTFEDGSRFRYSS